MGKKNKKLIFQAVPVRIIIPVVLTVFFFVLTIFLLILPILKDQMMARKREMIRELTKAAWSNLDAYHEKEVSGQITREKAQELAVEHLRHLRYGPNMKDYFWINDMYPHLVMHPYRTDLEGEDISYYADPNGKRLFVEFVNTIRNHGAGYVDYQWQWKDDPDKIVPKISYVKGFSPWNWIVGTGIYIEDVRAEIAAVTKKLTLTCLYILGIIVGLSSYIIWQGWHVDRQRREAEERSRYQQEQIFQAAKMASLGTLISGVAHEVNNPITSVMLNAPAMEKIWKSVSPVLEKYSCENENFQVGNMNLEKLYKRVPLLLSDISESARKVKAIVSDLKDFARQAPAEMKDSVDINNVVKKAVGLVKNLINKSTENFSVEYAQEIPCFIGNTQKVEQVVVNLLVNACQAITDSHQSISITTDYDRTTESVRIRVMDEGAGIPADILERIRDPFFTTKRDNGGTGLGLSISEKIIQDHGGHMQFESKPGKGTTVTITIPVNSPTTS
jgi:signal transduction histidine kinase